MKKNSFLPLYVTNLFGTMNDNLLKTLAGFVVVDMIVDPAMKSVLMGITAGALVLPFIVFSPLADRLTALFSKCRIVRIAKFAELPIVAIGIAGFALSSPWLIVAAVLLMGLQSSLYSPAKYALIRDIGGEGRISTGMGGMEGVAFCGMLAGTVLASLTVDKCPLAVHACALLFLALAGFAGSLTLRATEERNRSIHSLNPLRFFVRSYRMASRYQGLNAVVFMLCVFWWAAAMLQMGLLVYGKQTLGLDSAATGTLLCIAAVGLVVGQVVAGFVDRRHPLLVSTVATGEIAAALLACLFLAPMNAYAFAAVLALLALDLGFFKLPLDAEIQRTVKGPKLNTMLAYLNQVSFLFMLAASGCYALVGWLCGPGAFLLLLAAVFAVVPILFILNDWKVLLPVGRWIFFRRYDVRVCGHGIPPLSEGPYLVLPNHPAMVDPMLVCSTLGSLSLRPLVDEAFFSAGFVAPAVLRTVGAVSVPDLRKRRSHEGAKTVRGLHEVVLSALSDGENIVFYPGGHIQEVTDCESIGTRQLAHNVCRALPDGVRVLGVRTRGLKGSIWSNRGRASSPNFILTFVRSIFLWFLVSPFRPRRRVTMWVEDITDRVREWSQLSRREFNAALEGWYNQD